MLHHWQHSDLCSQEGCSDGPARWPCHVCPSSSSRKLRSWWYLAFENEVARVFKSLLKMAGAADHTSPIISTCLPTSNRISKSSFKWSPGQVSHAVLCIQRETHTGRWLAVCLLANVRVTWFPAEGQQQIYTSRCLYKLAGNHRCHFSAFWPHAEASASALFSLKRRLVPVHSSASSGGWCQIFAV